MHHELLWGMDGPAVSVAAQAALYKKWAQGAVVRVSRSIVQGRGRFSVSDLPTLAMRLAYKQRRAAPETRRRG